MESPLKREIGAKSEKRRAKSEEGEGQDAGRRRQEARGKMQEARGLIFIHIFVLRPDRP